MEKRNYHQIIIKWLPWWFGWERTPCQFRRLQRCELDPSVRKIPWRRKWRFCLGFLPGKFLARNFEERSLAGYSPQGHKVLDMTEQTHNKL